MATKKKEAPVVEEVTPVVDPADVLAEVDTPFDNFLDHQKKALNEAGRALESLIPVEFREHGRSAFKEVVEGYRTLFNSALDEIVDNLEKAKFNADAENKDKV